jgi:signal transduction histidine kinase
MRQQSRTDRQAVATAAENMREARVALMLQRGRITAGFGLTVYPLFAIADWLHFHDIVPIAIRLLATFGVALVLALSYTRWGPRHIFGLVVTGFIIAAAGLAGIIWRYDAFFIGYADGFIQLILTFCVFIPATTAPAAFACAGILALYLGPALLRYGAAAPPELGIWTVALSSATIIALIGRHIANTLWEREFNARQELQQVLSELQTTQRQLVQAEKMAALGRLTAGVAHELNNPLSVISANLRPLERATELLVKDTKDGKTDVTAVHQTITQSTTLLRRGVERAAAVVQNLRQYSTASRGRYAPTDLDAVLEMTVSLVAPKAREQGITIHRQYGALIPILCDAQSLSQVFVNVLENACDAIAQSGNIWVQTEMSLGQNSHASLPEGKPSVVITVSDDGPGVPTEHLAKLFDPFFTTKPPGAGMGLGLALAHRIIEDHDRQIKIANGSPGAVVSIILPATSSTVSVQTEGSHFFVQPATRDA